MDVAITDHAGIGKISHRDRTLASVIDEDAGCDRHHNKHQQNERYGRICKNSKLSATCQQGLTHALLKGMPENEADEQWRKRKAAAPEEKAEKASSQHDPNIKQVVVHRESAKQCQNGNRWQQVPWLNARYMNGRTEKKKAKDNSRYGRKQQRFKNGVNFKPVLFKEKRTGRQTMQHECAKNDSGDRVAGNTKR